MFSLFKVIFAAVPLVLLLLWGVNHFAFKNKDLPLVLDVKSRPYLLHTEEPTAEIDDIADKENVAVAAAGSDDEVKIAAEASPAKLLNDEVSSTVSERADSESDADIDADADLIVEAQPTQGLELAAAVPVDGSGDATTTEAPTIKPSLEARQQAIRERLGISNTSAPAPTPAIDVQYLVPPGCQAGDVALAPVTISYRFNSPAIKGSSLNVLETIIAEYRLCGGGSFKMSRNPLAEADESPALGQRRLDELKYFFIQHSVPKSALEYPEDL
ncbi:MAG: hypothetical protein AB8B79_17700 [Granulosicoccus sp.]